MADLKKKKLSTRERDTNFEVIETSAFYMKTTRQVVDEKKNKIAHLLQLKSQYLPITLTLEVDSSIENFDASKIEQAAKGMMPVLGGLFKVLLGELKPEGSAPNAANWKALCDELGVPAMSGLYAEDVQLGEARAAPSFFPRPVRTVSTSLAPRPALTPAPPSHLKMTTSSQLAEQDAFSSGAEPKSSHRGKKKVPEPKTSHRGKGPSTKARSKRGDAATLVPALPASSPGGGLGLTSPEQGATAASDPSIYPSIHESQRAAISPASGQQIASSASRGGDRGDGGGDRGDGGWPRLPPRALPPSWDQHRKLESEVSPRYSLRSPSSPP